MPMCLAVSGTLFSKYLLCACVSGSVPGTGVTVIQTDTVPALEKFTS